MAPIAATTQRVRVSPAASFARSEAAIRLRPRTTVPGRRRALVTRAAEADRSKNQNTVGDLSPDQVKAALDRQVQLSSAKKGTPSTASNSQPTPAADAKDGAPVTEATPPPARGVTEVERAESVRALEDLKKRVPLMSQDDLQAAIDRLLAKGDSAAISSGDGSEGGGNSSGSETGDRAPADGSSGSGKKGKHDPDHVYDDGSLLFTAETLAKVDYS